MVHHAPNMHLTLEVVENHLKELMGWMGWIYPRRSLPGPKSWIPSSESPVFPHFQVKHSWNFGRVVKVVGKTQWVL